MATIHDRIYADVIVEIKGMLTIGRSDEDLEQYSLEEQEKFIEDNKRGIEQVVKDAYELIILQEYAED
jgi:hypothetical protein